MQCQIKIQLVKLAVDVLTDLIQFKIGKVLTTMYVVKFLSKNYDLRNNWVLA